MWFTFTTDHPWQQVAKQGCPDVVVCAVHFATSRLALPVPTGSRARLEVHSGRVDVPVRTVQQGHVVLNQVARHHDYPVFFGAGASPVSRVLLLVLVLALARVYHGVLANKIIHYVCTYIPLPGLQPMQCRPR